MGRMDAGPSEIERDELISRLRVIEGQPLPERAAAYTALHDALARDLEAGPASASAS
jgi:hypothetical protein